MVFHCALRGRRLQGSRFVLDVPGSSPATPSKTLVFLRVFAYSSIIVRFGGVVFFDIGAVARKGLFSTVSERFRDAHSGGFFERSIVGAP